MLRPFSYLSILLALTLFSACTDASSSNSDVEKNVLTDTTIVTDSLQTANEQTNDTNTTVKKNLHLDSTEKQLDYMAESPSWDKYATGILPQMAEDAPEYCQKILEKEGSRFIIVDKGKMKLFLYDPYGNIEKSYGIACAKNFGTKHKKGDSRTTEGIVEVKGVFDSTNWLFTDDNGYTSPVKGQYGPRFIRLTIPYIGIHGTGSPRSIGKRCSHGCIRVTNDNILELVKYVEEGMPVIISPGPRDMAVNQKEGYKVLSVSTEPGSPRAVPGKHVPPSNIAEEKAKNVEKSEEFPAENLEEKISSESKDEVREEPSVHSGGSEETKELPKTED